MFNFKRILFLFSFLSLSISQRDPLKDFCRIHGHQTTIVDRRLYIDGGLVNWSPLTAQSINYTSTWLRYGDLDVDNEGFPQNYLLSKNESVPSVHGGVLWSDESNKVIYLYGGEYGNEEPEDFALWYYDIIYDTWNRSDTRVTDIKRASWEGAGVAVQDKARGYYYGGWLTDFSVPGYRSRTALSNMLVYDMLAGTFRNQTGPDDIPRAEGVMIYLPAGDSGLLVYFGGIQFPYNNETEAALPMTDIYVYDIGNDLWYKQSAGGAEIPQNRRRFCAGAAWVDDRSSYNIYLFGGASVGDGVGFGDVWILSLPSFTWIKYWPREEDGVGATFPHHSLTCDVIENSQMIIMGGSFPNMSTECDVPLIYGQHGLDLGKANVEGAKWALFNPKVTQYKVPSEIAQTIGGGATGGATVLAPTQGWEERDLREQFQRAYTPTTRTATRYIPAPTSPPITSGKSNKKAIIGGAVGGAVGGLLLVAAVGICFCIRRRKRNQQNNRHSPSELPSEPTAQTTLPPTSTQQGFFVTPSVTQYGHTMQGSPSPPLDGQWSRHTSVPPSYPAVSGPFESVSPASGRHYSRDSPSFKHSVQSSSAEYYEHVSNSPVTSPQEMPNVRSPPLQEMPNVRSPIGFAAQPQPGDPNVTGIDPYFAQHPPRGAEKAE